MNNNNDSTTSPSSLDTTIDQRIETKMPIEETYEQSAGNKPVSNTPNPVSDTTPTSKSSSILAEVERAVANDVLPSRQQRLSVFGLNLSRRNDFRLKELSRRLDTQLQRDHATEISTGSQPLRLRDFDLKSQAMRQITANATLGSYQFQKTQVLPYMRKSLALSYQRTNLLKKVVGGIQSMEVSLLSKLEAIKLNTGAVVPEKESFFTKMKNAVKAKNFDRIATNISNAIMDRADAVYRQKVSPIMAKLHKTMTDKSRKGGINGVNNALRMKLNSIRHSLEEFAERDSSTLSTLGRLRQSGTRIGMGVAAGVIKLGQKAKLSVANNLSMSEKLSSYTETLDKIKPYGNPNAAGALGGMFEDTPQPTTEIAPRKRITDTLLQRLDDWNQESAQRQMKLLDHVKAIRNYFAPVRKRSVGSTGSASAPKTAAPAKLPAPTLQTPPNTVSGRMKAMTLGRPALQSIPLNKGNVSFGMPPIAGPAVKLASPAVTATAGIAAAPGVGLGQRINTATKSIKDPAQQMFGKLFGALSAKLDAVNTSIKTGDTEQIKLERDQIKHQSFLEKLAAKAKIRKGSYEDLMAQREAAKNRDNNPWRLKPGQSAAAAAAAAAAGSDDESSGSILDKIKDKAKSMFEDKMDSVGEGDDDGDEGAGKKGKGKAKGSRRSRLARIKARRAARSGARGGIFKRGLRLLGRGAKGAVGGVGRGAWGLTKGAAKMGGRGALGVLKSGGKGALTLAKGGLGIGLAAGVAQHYFDKSGATGDVKKAGDTAFSMAQYGGIGATVGGMFGGIGAIPGAALGASVGAVVANADYASAQLKGLGSGVANAGRGIWSFIFGQNAIVKPDGTVVQKEKSSILGDLKIALMGRKARYSSSGEVIATERGNLIGNVQYGFQKLLFGDKFDNGEYKQGTSLIEMARKSISDSLVRFGKDIMAIPGNVKKEFADLSEKASKLAKVAKEKTVAGAKATGSYLADKATKLKNAATGTAASVSTKAAGFYKNVSSGNFKDAFKINIGTIGQAMYYATPTGFAVGASAAIFGWGIEEGTYTNPASPHYGFVTQVLEAYGIKNRELYRFIHSLELSQDKINRNQTKPFDDNDMAYMAGRFGFDAKNKESVNYFKLWYKRRFIPGMAIIGKVLMGHKLTFGSVLGSDEKEIVKITADLKKELGTSDLKTMGLEPSPQAYNKYAKIGNADPGKVSVAALAKNKPFDPRDPKNASAAANKPLRMGSQFGSMNYGGGGFGDHGLPAAASRKSAVMAKGGIKDQPEYKTAYTKLPPKLRKAIDKSKSLQFVLWSTSVQHGADTASQIFQRDYSESLDDKSIIKKIYDDRSQRFGNLSGDDRAEAVGHLSEEQRIAFGIQDGTQSTDRGTMGNILSNVIDPSGNYSGYNGPAMPVPGKIADRAKIAMRFFMSRGYNKNAAAGIVGNLIEESNLNPNAAGDYENPRTRTNPRAKGLGQWWPDRRGPIAAKFGKPIEAMRFEEQLAAVDWEIKGGGRGGVGRDLPGALNNAGSAQQAAVTFMQRFERPKDHASNGPNARKRSGAALGVLKLVDGAGALTGGYPQVSGSPAPVRGGSTPPPAGNKPAAKPAQPRRPAPKKAAPEKHDYNAWNAGLDNHAKSMNEVAKAMQAIPAALRKEGPGGDTNNIVLSPLMQQPQKRGGGFVTASVKKSMIAVGDH